MTNDCRLSYVDTKFLTSAVTALEECRAVLAYTYAFAYYLSTNNQKHILEDNQKDLELVTEDLTAHLERDLADDPFRDADDCKQFKIKVQDYTRFILAHYHNSFLERHFAQVSVLMGGPIFLSLNFSFSHFSWTKS